MKIWILSDVHDEVYGWAPPSIPDADLCIIAGDVARAAQEHADWIGHFIRPHMPCVSVLGNHEFYHRWLERERSEAQYHSRRTDIHVLDDMTWTQNGVRFVGATLWTDFRLYAGTNDAMRKDAMDTAMHTMRDYSAIHSKDWRPFRPEATAAMHATSVAYIESVLATPFDGETVVVTHHGVSHGSVADEWDGDPSTPAFSSDLSNLIERCQPALWIHGHTHNSRDYEIGSTREICNPHGYGSQNPDFDPAMVIELGEPKPRPGGP